MRRVSDNAIDAQLQYIIDNAERIVVLDADPVDYAGVSAAQLAEIAVDSGDFSLGDGDISGRKLVVAAQTAVDATATGTGNHVAIVDDTGMELLLLVEMPNVNITISIDTNIASFAYEVRDPVGS
jgi:hypothetical protein